jgi:hypothetical protein
MDEKDKEQFLLPHIDEQHLIPIKDEQYLRELRGRFPNLSPLRRLSEKETFDQWYERVFPEARLRQRIERQREREQLISLLDKHEDWLIEEIDRRKAERDLKAHTEAQQSSQAEPTQWEPPPRVAPPTGWRESANPPWYRSAIDDLQQRIDRANGPYQLPEEGWD